MTGRRTRRTIWKTKSRHRPPSVYFRGCRPIFSLFMKQRDGFFSFFNSTGPQRLRVSQLFFIYSRSESSCELHPLANVLHLPLSTCCLIHPFPNALFFPCPKVLVMDTWWITGYWKGRVTQVRSDQIGRLNSRFLVRRRWWGGCGGERKRRKEWVSRGVECGLGALPYVSVSPRSPARGDRLIHYLHDLSLKSAAGKHYKTVACWFCIHTDQQRVNECWWIKSSACWRALDLWTMWSTADQ